MTTPTYPGRVLKYTPKNIMTGGDVRAVQEELNRDGCGPIDTDSKFGKDTEAAVKLFQMRNTEADGTPLTVDGQVGAITWAVLFGAETVPSVMNGISAPTSLLKAALDIAISQIGVMESPRGSNRGPQVDEYLRSVGLDPEGNHYAWCMAFVYWSYNKAATELNRSNPLVKTAGCLYHWNNAVKKGARRITREQAMDNPGLIKPGHIFIMDHGGGAGHTGLVERVEGGRIITVEGNTGPDGTREGIGVYRRTRKIASINKGFIDYSGV